jgi:hypothetical protein
MAIEIRGRRSLRRRYGMRDCARAVGPASTFVLIRFFTMTGRLF